MDVKDAVFAAKDYVIKVFADEGIRDVGLEAVEFDEARNEWRVTIGFSRAWENPAGPLQAFTDIPRRRVYKVVHISENDKKPTAIRPYERAA
jgi:hypothetical protein